MLFALSAAWGTFQRLLLPIELLRGADYVPVLAGLGLGSALALGAWWLTRNERPSVRRPVRIACVAICAVAFIYFGGAASGVVRKLPRSRIVPVSGRNAPVSARIVPVSDRKMPVSDRIVLVSG